MGWKEEEGSLQMRIFAELGNFCNFFIAENVLLLMAALEFTSL
jgi:hypothetical protein